ncbi:MAG: tetratricopeptide repeat protein [Balneolaceae bacterium]|nr:tetratricopeptide repeat protein [Balneolaceae bacterium]
MNLGNTRSSQGRFKEAESLYKQALALSEKVRPDSPPVQIQYNLGELFYRMGELQEAESYFKQSLENSERGGLAQGIYYNAAGLGNVADQRGNVQEAMQWHNRALDVAQKLQNPSFMQSRHQRLYELSKQQDSLRLALQHLEQSKELSDSLMTTEQNRIAAEYQTKLELQLQQQQNQELEAESERQASQLEVQNWLIGAGLLVIIIIGVFTALLYRANRKSEKSTRICRRASRSLRKPTNLKINCSALWRMICDRRLVQL